MKKNNKVKSPQILQKKKKKKEQFQLQNTSRSGVGGWKPCRRRGSDATPPWISLSFLRKESRRRTDDSPSRLRSGCLRVTAACTESGAVQPSGP